MTSEKEVFPHVLKILQKLNISYMIGGSVASIAYGEPRLTILRSNSANSFLLNL